MYKYSDVYTNLYTFVCIYACPVDRHCTPTPCLAPRAQQVLPTPQRFGSPRADHQEFWLKSTASNNSNANR